MALVILYVLQILITATGLAGFSVSFEIPMGHCHGRNIGLTQAESDLKSNHRAFMQKVRVCGVLYHNS